jgi:hypothetical protein
MATSNRYETIKIGNAPLWSDKEMTRNGVFERPQ